MMMDARLKRSSNFRDGIKKIGKIYGDSAFILPGLSSSFSSSFLKRKKGHCKGDHAGI